jgi:hypothetical protein
MPERWPELGPLNSESIDLLSEGTGTGSTGSESDELNTGCDESADSESSQSTSKSEQILRNLNTATQQTELESDSDIQVQVDPAQPPPAIPKVGKRKRGRPSKKVIEPTGGVIKILLAESSLILCAYTSSSSC